jgi:glucosamine-6-phosphate deaminase
VILATEIPDPILQALLELGGVDWPCITLFHMDEYLGISADHPATSVVISASEWRAACIARVPLPGRALLPLDECARYARLLLAQPIDLLSGRGREQALA